MLVVVDELPAARVNDVTADPESESAVLKEEQEIAMLEAVQEGCQP